MIYFALAIAVVAFPQVLLVSINFVPDKLKILESTPETPHHLIWTLPLILLLLLLSLLSLFSSFSPRAKGYLAAHVLTKIASAGGLFYIYKYQKPYFACVVGIAVEILIALLLLIFGLGAAWVRRKNHASALDHKSTSDPELLSEASTASMDVRNL